MKLKIKYIEEEIIMCKKDIINEKRNELIKDALTEKMANLTTRRKELKSMINSLDAGEHYERIAILQAMVKDVDDEFYAVLDYYVNLK